MNIGILIPELIKEGGGERLVLVLASQLQKMGNQVTVYTCAYDAERCYPKLTKGLSVVSTGHRRWLGRWGRTFFALDFIFQCMDMRVLANAVKQHHDVLNAHPYPAHLAALWVKMKTGTPVVYHANDLYVYPPSESIFGRRKGTQLTLREKLRTWIAFATQWPVLLYENYALHRIDKIIVLCQWLADKVASVHRLQTRIIPPGTDLDMFSPDPSGRDEAWRLQKGIRQEEYLILCTNSLLPHRRYEDVVEAALLLRKKGYPVRLWIVGRPSQAGYAAQLTKLIHENNAEDIVHLIGAVPEDDLPRYYRACDLYVFPAQWETWSLSVTEAMGCRKPVLLSTAAGFDGYLHHGVEALLFDPCQPQIIASLAENLITDPRLALRLAENGYQWVHENVSWESYTARVYDVFNETAGTAERPMLNNTLTRAKVVL